MLLLLLQVADLDFLTAPHKVNFSWSNNKVEIGEGDEEGYSWWLLEEEDKRLEESLALVEGTVREGGYHGLLCFSQGAALGGLLARLQHRGTIQLDICFCILVSGYIPGRHRDKFSLEDRICLPSLHVVGQKDVVLDQSRSRELAAQFQDPVVCLHPGGHFLPHTGDVREAVLAFLNARLENIQRRTKLRKKQPNKVSSP